MANKKIEYRLRDVFREASSMAHAIRWQYLLFLGILFLLIYFVSQLTASVLGKPSTPRQAYLLSWVLMPVVIQLLAALYISAVSYTAAFKKFMMGKAHSQNYFDYFTKLFAVSVIVFYITHCLDVIIFYPGIAKQLLGYRNHVYEVLILLSFVLYLLLNTFLMFSFLHVLFGEHGVRSSLTASYRQIKPHYYKIFVLMLAFLFGISVPYALVRLGFKYLNMSNLQTSEIVHGIGFCAIGIGLLVWLSPILVSAFLISYKKLGMNASG
ncbi:hypothetical protein [Candidiatus Paracoxiella cheracis]|uniref:hypothetical protein n=1 Tax=Candidiatus Paracoxiella cheracis TaxID=3405120 RepID=UPI003BF47CB7